MAAPASGSVSAAASTCDFDRSSSSTSTFSSTSKLSASQLLPPVLPLLDTIQVVPRQFTSTCEPLQFLRRIDRIVIPRVEIASDGVVFYHLQVFLHHEPNRIPSNQRHQDQNKLLPKHHPPSGPTITKPTTTTIIRPRTHHATSSCSSTTQSTFTTTDRPADLVVLRRFSDFSTLRNMLWQLTSFPVPLTRNSGYSCSCCCAYCGRFRKWLTNGFCRQPSWLMRLLQHNLHKRCDQLQAFVTGILELACRRSRNCKCHCVGHEKIPSLLEMFLTLDANEINGVTDACESRVTRSCVG